MCGSHSARGLQSENAHFVKDEGFRSLTEVRIAQSHGANKTLIHDDLLESD